MTVTAPGTQLIPYNSSIVFKKKKKDADVPSFIGQALAED